MALPTYNRNNRRKVFEALPKGAYVIKILSAKTTQSSWGEDQIAIAFDIAEGEYKDFYKGQFDRNTSEDKKWPIDAIYYLTIPHDGCADYVVTNYDSFFADLEDSNGGFVFAGDTKSLRNKLIGGKFHIEQTSYNGNIYNHTRMKWTCVADDVRNNKAGRMPKDKLIGEPRSDTLPSADPDGFMVAPEDEELPF